MDKLIYFFSKVHYERILSQRKCYNVEERPRLKTINGLPFTAQIDYIPRFKHQIENYKTTYPDFKVVALLNDGEGNIEIEH